MKRMISLALLLLFCFSLAACGENTTGSPPAQPTVAHSNKLTVEGAKQRLAVAYKMFCSGSNNEYASLASDNMSLTIDTKPNDSYYRGEGAAVEAIVDINRYLGLPSSLIEKMSSTRALDGMQTQNCDGYTVTWTYHPDNGLKVIYEVNL